MEAARVTLELQPNATSVAKDIGLENMNYNF